MEIEWIVVREWITMQNTNENLYQMTREIYITYTVCAVVKTTLSQTSSKGNFGMGSTSWSAFIFCCCCSLVVWMYMCARVRFFLYIYVYRAWCGMCESRHLPIGNFVDPYWFSIDIIFILCSISNVKLKIAIKFCNLWLKIT